MNPITYIKGLIALALVTTIALAYNHYDGMIEDNATLTATVETQKNDLKAAQEAEDGYKSTISGIAKGMGELNTSLAAERATVAETRRIFGNHDFEKIAKAKPTMVTSRMISATNKVFREIEATANEDN